MKAAGLVAASFEVAGARADSATSVRMLASAPLVVSGMLAEQLARSSARARTRGRRRARSSRRSRSRRASCA